jgi:predicted GIY-YIG superfamily endonuclease
MPKYENARVYYIKNLDTNKYYIGSTTQKYLSKRIHQHYCNSKSNPNCTSREVFETDNYFYGVIYDCACNNIDDLRSLEYQTIEEYIKEGKCVVNMVRRN